MTIAAIFRQILNEVTEAQEFLLRSFWLFILRVVFSKIFKCFDKGKEILV